MGDLESIRRALDRAPQDPLLWQQLATALEREASLDISPRLLAELTTCLRRPQLASRKLVHAANSLFLRLTVVDELMASRDGLRFARWDEIVRQRGGACSLEQLSHPLFVTLLMTDRLAYRDTDLFLSTLRRHLLAAAADGGLEAVLWPGALDFLAALGVQCFLTDYAYLETPEETAGVEALAKAAGRSHRSGREPRPEPVALLGCYRPLGRYGFARQPRRLKALLASPAGTRLLMTQVEEPRREQQLARGIERLTPVRDRTSQQVRGQYEQNPYPRWLHVRAWPPMTPDDYLARCLPRAEAPLPTLPEAPEVLIAGGGTGHHPISVACALPAARVTAIDLSLASLAYARRKAEDLGLANLAFAQADILELGGWERRFAMIQSSGVLHHLDDPAAGLAVLTGLLAEGGVIKLGLYSERARRDVAAARDFIAAGDYPPGPEGMRRARHDLMTLPDDHPARAITESRDFHTLSTCRDLLFHVREHCFTPMGLAELLAGAGLRLLGFQGLDADTAQAYASRFPDDPAMTDLDNWDRFERDRPDTFVGMYQFWAARG